jgi:hypothetical protein
MLAALWPILRWFAPASLALFGDDLKLPEPDLEWLERNASILYPLMGGGTVALMAWAVLSALRTVRIPVEQKMEYKREVIAMLRREIPGVSEERIAKQLELSAKEIAIILGELERDGVIAPASKGKKGAVWRMRAFVDGG